MKIEVKTEGGLAYLPGLRRPTTLRSEDMPAEEEARLRRLVVDAHFFDQPSQVGATPRGAADYQCYVITIEDEGQRHTVKMTDLGQDATLRALLDFLQAQVREQRRAARLRPPSAAPRGATPRPRRRKGE